jgi:hypothetical protein
MRRAEPYEGYEGMKGNANWLDHYGSHFSRNQGNESVMRAHFSGQRRESIAQAVGGYKCRQQRIHGGIQAFIFLLVSMLCAALDHGHQVQAFHEKRFVFHWEIHVAGDGRDDTPALYQAAAICGNGAVLSFATTMASGPSICVSAPSRLVRYSPSLSHASLISLA